MRRLVREQGCIIPISSCGNNTASGHPFCMERISREVSLCNPHSSSGLQILGPSILRSLRLVGKPMRRLVREQGSIIPIFSWGNNTATGHPSSMDRIPREVSLCNPHSISGLQILGPPILSCLRLVGMPSSGKNVTLEQFVISNSSTQLRLCISSGRAWSLSQDTRLSTLRFEVGKPLSGKETKFEQLPTCMSRRWLSLFNP